MDTFCSSLSSSPLPSPPRNRKIPSNHRPSSRVLAGGRSIDEDMIVLRKRMHEIEMTVDEDRTVPAPEGWMGWEKQYYYERYSSDVCEGVEALQGLLLRTRPAVALGMAGLLATSVTTTGLLALFELLHFLDLIICSLSK